jgi:aminoglycoside phosphotransferase family enzyme
MTKEQIEILTETSGYELVETHISWVLISDTTVYKIKKPVSFSFLDFSTPEKRKQCCEAEVRLNKRLTEDIYIDVQPIERSGSILDYAVRMHKIDRQLQMDVLLAQNKVTDDDIRRLAEKMVAFHQSTAIIYDKDPLDIPKQFTDLKDDAHHDIIDRAMACNDEFMQHHTDLLKSRVQDGFIRDCHGDLHTRNIFLLNTPQPFDCIEFNDDIRQIDVLNEIAFLCMDLDAAGRQDLSTHFATCYNERFPIMNTTLFNYYKAYRANVRAKINLLGQQQEEAGKYLQLMDQYLKML